MLQTVKTTVNFSTAFHAKLKLLADVEQTSMAQVIEEYMDPVVTQSLDEKQKKVYQGLWKLAGSVKKNIPDASATIDQTLYS